jgi:hypothetical protein
MKIRNAFTMIADYAAPGSRMVPATNFIGVPPTQLHQNDVILMSKSLAIALLESVTLLDAGHNLETLLYKGSQAK